MSTVLATGAFLKNRAGLWRRGQFHVSPVHGDLGTPAACIALEASVEALCHIADGHVDAVAHDLHPDFHSTRVAQALAARLGVPAIAVQHHVAHIASVLAEQGSNGPVIGIALDGFGLGPEGAAWGGELLLLDGARWQRVGHLAPLALPGGDRAAREPWRLAAAALHAMGRGHEIEARLAPQVGETAARAVAGLLRRGLNCPPTSSAGRWFDAAAGALGLSVRQAHEAEAAMALERLAATVTTAASTAPAVAMPVHDGVIDPLPLLAHLFAHGDDPAAAAACFHHALADALAQAAATAAHRHGTQTVVLAGGCFLNRVLSARLEAQLEHTGLTVLCSRDVADCGDAGLARGQAWMAAMQLAHQETTSCA